MVIPNRESRSNIFQELRIVCQSRRTDGRAKGRISRKATVQRIQASVIGEMNSVIPRPTTALPPQNKGTKVNSK